MTMTKPTLPTIIVVFSLAGAGACGADPYAGSSDPDAASVTTPVSLNYQIDVAPIRKLDLLFMIDDSPSMAPKVAKLNAQ